MDGPEPQGYADCIIALPDRGLLMQYRPPHWRTAPDTVALFGGRIEAGETPAEAAARELQEETGATVRASDLQSVIAVPEGDPVVSSVVHVHFWRDAAETVTGCYEAEAIVFPDLEAALAHPKLMPYAREALLAARERGLL